VEAGMTHFERGVENIEGGIDQHLDQRDDGKSSQEKARKKFKGTRHLCPASRGCQVLFACFSLHSDALKLGTPAGVDITTVVNMNLERAENVMDKGLTSGLLPVEQGFEVLILARMLNLALSSCICQRRFLTR